MSADQSVLTPSPDTHELPRVNILGRRFLAALLDFIFLSVLGWIVNTAFGITHVTGGTLPQPGQNGFSYYTSVTTVDWWWMALLAFSYFFIQEALLSVTLGKAIMRLRVIPSSDQRKIWHIALWQAFVRNMVRPFEVTQLPYTFGVSIIAALCILMTKKRQRLGDLLARTIVVASTTTSYPAYRPSQMYIRTGIILVMVVCLIGFCSIFYYYGRPPLVIQSLQNTHELLDGTVQSYTLGSPSWGTDNEVKSTVSYPIHFISIDKGKKQRCDGLVTLRWYDYPVGWSQYNSHWHCSPS